MHVTDVVALSAVDDLAADDAFARSAILRTIRVARLVELGALGS